MTNLQPRLLGQVLLYNPAGPSGSSLETSAQEVIRWSAPNAERVDLEYSMDGGLNWQLIAAGVDSAEGSIAWTPPRRNPPGLFSG